MHLTYYLDVSVMLAQKRFTGIAAVACAMADWFLNNRGQETVFFAGSDVIRPNAIEALVRMRSGEAVSGRKIGYGRVTEDISTVMARTGDRVAVGITPNIKTVRNLFDYEAQVIHDLTYAVMPELHLESVVATYGSTVDIDVRSNDLNICVSEWTKHDLVTYVGADPDLCLVAHLGYHRAGLVKMPDVEPYYLMLGTIEPRKNHALVLAAIRQDPDILKGRRLVIAGDDGWGETLQQLLDRHGLTRMLGREIVYAGFVSDQVRAKLVSNARALFYPSLYEGFGLPVLESIAAGTPVITSMRSSLPEVGGDAAFYVDPESVESFIDCVHRLEAALGDPIGRADIEARMQRQAAKFSWDSFHRTITTRIEDDLAKGRYRERKRP